LGRFPGVDQRASSRCTEGEDQGKSSRTTGERGKRMVGAYGNGEMGGACTVGSRAQVEGA
jgi:hypothetical protein